MDDEEHVLQTTRTMLEESGFTVVTAVDGVEGVEVFRNQAARLSAVVLDMNMPRLDGAEAFRQMHRIAPGVPVILTSGFDEQDAVSEFTGAGLAGFIQKPYRMKALLQKTRGRDRRGTRDPRRNGAHLEKAITKDAKPGADQDRPRKSLNLEHRAVW